MAGHGVDRPHARRRPPGGLCFARFEFAGKRLLWSLLLVPFVLPTVVVGSAVLGVVGPRSPVGVDLHGTIWAILLAHVFFNYAVVVRTVGGVLGQPRPDARGRGPGLRARRSGGRSGRSRWPLLRPAVLAASSIVFLFSFTSFGVVLLLGGPGFNTLEVEIYTQTTRLLRLDIAAVLAIVQFGAVLAVLLVYSIFSPSPLGGHSACARRSRRAGRCGEPARALFLAANLVFMGLLLGVPLGVLVLRSIDFGSSRFWSHYSALGSAAAGECPVRPADRGRSQLAHVRAGRDGHRAGDRRLGIVGHRRHGLAPHARRARARPGVDDAARHVGGHRRLRVLDRARPSAARPPRLAGGWCRSRTPWWPCRS